MKSFIEYPDTSHFPIQNLPYGVFSKAGNGERRIGCAIGEFVLDLTGLEAHGMLDATYFRASTLNAFMAAGKEEWARVRSEIQTLLLAENPVLRDNAALREKVLLRQSEVAPSLLMRH